jgi:hypothetical protein
VRNASYTSLDTAKYGPYIAPLQLSVSPQTQKIYNRLANQSNISVPANSIAPKEIVKYQNVFVENNTVNLTMSNLSVKGTTISQADSGVTETISYGLGQAYIRISPFDNYYKFTFYKRNANGTMDLLDLTSSGTFKLVFIDNKNNKLFAPSIADKNLANAAQGELAFKVDQSLANQILTFTNRRFYVSNQPIIAETNSVAGRLPFSRLSGVKQRLASKALSTTDSIKDVQLAAQDLTTADNSLGTSRISGSSSSVLYYGRWLNDSEPIPSIQIGAGTSGLGSPVNQSNITTAVSGESRTSGSDLTPVQSYWQRVFLSGGTSGTSGANTTGGIGIQTQVLNALGIVAFKASIASDVQGKIASGWATEQIINYFLNPAAAGFKIYSGITKQIFTDAVTGIFSTEDLALLNVYGNTRGGLDDGGSAASGGSTSNQSGSDSGSPQPQFPPIPPRNSGGTTRPQPGRPRGTF